MFSVIIPSYKMSKFIGEALSSVGVQSCRDWEVIVVEDCGPEDGTEAIVRDFAKAHPNHRVEFIRHGRNRVPLSRTHGSAAGGNDGEDVAGAATSPGDGVPSGGTYPHKNAS